MRRGLFVLGMCGMFGCGLSAVAGNAGEDGGLAGDGATLEEVGNPGDSGPADAAIDVDRPDAGVAFVPSHISPGSYTLTAGAVIISAASTINTTNGTINGVAPVGSTILQRDGFAVWSVGSLTTSAPLTVVGDRPLVIVSAGAVTIGDAIVAHGESATPGPGGSLSAAGVGKGANGTRIVSQASGGGGAGHGTAGGSGGDKWVLSGGIAGVVANAGAALLVGGAGGGNGGGFALGTCADSGRGGVGGGAIQISAVGKISIASAGGIDIGGGGGDGGNGGVGGPGVTLPGPGVAGGDSGGGGGGATGRVFLRTRGVPAVVAGTVAAQRVDDPAF